MTTTILILATIGSIISLYTYWIERKIKDEPAYKPACDLSDRISCTKPMRSPYAHIFYFSNALMSTGYYVAVAMFAYFNATHILLIASIGSCIVSVFLAYILYFKINSLCMLCTALYLINFLILSSILFNLN